MSKPTPQAPKAVQDCHDLLAWLIPQLDKFPRNRRFTLGERIESKVIHILECLVSATLSKRWLNGVPKLKVFEGSKMRYKQIGGLLGIFVLSCITPKAYAFGFDDLEKVEAAEQTELLELAKQAARNNNFSKAESFIKQAQHKGYAPAQLNEAKQVLTQSRAAYQAEQERLRLAEQRRQQAEEQRLAEQRSRQHSTPSNGGVNSVIVAVSCVAAICVPEQFKVTGGSASINQMYNSVSLHDIGSGIAGQYQYSVKLTPINRYCSGSFTISGTKQNVTVNVYENCNAYLNEY